MLKSASVLKPSKPINITEVNSPRTAKIIAKSPEIICPLRIPINPRIKASGERTIENIKMPTKPTITPAHP